MFALLMARCLLEDWTHFAHRLLTHRHMCDVVFSIRKTRRGSDKKGRSAQSFQHSLKKGDHRSAHFFHRFISSPIAAHPLISLKCRSVTLNALHLSEYYHTNPLSIFTQSSFWILIAEQRFTQPENPFSQLAPNQTIAIVPEFTFESGYTIHNVPVAYKTWGVLNELGDNCMLICHPLTRSVDVEDW